ncbi:hypothetical protein [Nocardioides speluncae]|uniref:hypothetical protein n=1 Tax=Nocardioides speluncae TaxID=2670337 RepID=UPI000D699857|nr:hypothetical protein [Nocardioides speluncae]
MAARVYLHIGLPKTGTTYLQTILWQNRPALRDAGLLVPGRQRRDHLWSSLVVREDPKIGVRDPRARESWQVVRRELEAWDGDGVVSHEFFCSATQEQAARMVAELAPADVHVVVTAREPLGLFTSSWQESLKNQGTIPIDQYGRGVSDDPQKIWDWRALDLGLVLERWGSAVPPERVHVIAAPPPGSPRTELWARLCAVLGVDPDLADTSGSFPNESMGLVEAETLRRINEQLRGFDTPHERGVWIRTFLADERLVPRDGERFWPGEDQVADCRARGRAAVDRIVAEGYDVVGDLDALLVPDELEPRRHPSSVTDAEIADVAIATVARLMRDVREASEAAEQPAEPAPHAEKAGRQRRSVTSVMRLRRTPR